MFGNWRHNKMKLGIAGTIMAFAALLPFGAVLAQYDPGLLVPMDHPMALFLESRVDAASGGATNEFRKMEWTAVDPVNNPCALMGDERSQQGDDRRRGRHKRRGKPLGIVYAGDLDADNNITKIYPYIVGGPYNAETEKTSAM